MRKISPTSRPLTRANRRPMPSRTADFHMRTALSLFGARKRGAYRRVAQSLLCTPVQVSWTCVHGRRVCEFYRNITWAQKSPHFAGLRPAQMLGQCLLARRVVHSIGTVLFLQCNSCSRMICLLGEFGLFHHLILIFTHLCGASSAQYSFSYVSALSRQQSNSMCDAFQRSV